MKNALLLLALLCSIAACTGKKHVSGKGPWYDSATIAFTQQIADDSTKAAPYYSRGQALHKMGEDSLALQDFMAAVKRDSSKAEYHSSIGSLMFEHKDISGSVPWLQTAIRLNPNDPLAHLRIARIFLFTKEYPKAFTEINTVLRQDAYNSEAYFLKGMLYKDMNDTAHAISSFQTALSVDPNYHDAALQLGLMYASNGNALGLQYLDNAYRQDTNDVLPLYAKGMYYQDLNQYEDAKAQYREAIRRDRVYTNGYFNYGYLLLQQDSAAAALKEFDLAVQSNPNDNRALFYRGLAKEKNGDKDGAGNDIREAAKVLKDNPEVQQALKRVGG